VTSIGNGILVMVVLIFLRLNIDHSPGCIGPRIGWTASMPWK